MEQWMVMCTHSLYWSSWYRPSMQRLTDARRPHALVLAALTVFMERPSVLLYPVLVAVRAIHLRCFSLYARTTALGSGDVRNVVTGRPTPFRLHAESSHRRQLHARPRRQLVCSSGASSTLSRHQSSTARPTRHAASVAPRGSFRLSWAL